MTTATVYSELERIRARDGALRASVVVAEAEPEQSPIHDQFTWDNDKAAHEYRLIEARHLIRSVTVVIEQRETPAYAHVGIAGAEGYYQHVQVLVQPANRDEYLLALNDLRAKVAALSRSVQALERVANTPERIEIAQAISGQVRSAAQALAGAA